MKENFKNPIGQQNNTAKNFFTIYSWRLKVIKKEATAIFFCNWLNNPWKPISSFIFGCSFLTWDLIKRGFLISLHLSK